MDWVDQGFINEGSSIYTSFGDGGRDVFAAETVAIMTVSGVEPNRTAESDAKKVEPFENTETFPVGAVASADNGVEGEGREVLIISDADPRVFAKTIPGVFRKNILKKAINRKVKNLMFSFIGKRMMYLLE